METFRKRRKGDGGRSATVTGVGRLALALGAAALLAAGIAANGATTGTSPDPTTTVATAPAVVAFTGRGYGHGLGLSQWGAYGYALHGWTHERILAHYYPGTTIGRAGVTSVRVLVAEKKQAVLSATAAWAVTDGTGVRTDLEPGQVALGRGLVVNGAALPGPLTFTSAEPLAVGDRSYRGKLVVDAHGKLVDVVDLVGLEQYLAGVVPAEMPSKWPPEALQAQAIAARSYALANRASGRSFDLYGDARSQVYGGVAAESPAATAAIEATKGQVVRYAGAVADTLFSSTSGGRTASSLEATGVDVPYLVSVPDPYDSVSPYHRWGPVLLDAAAVAKRLSIPAPIVGVDVEDGPSGRAARLVATAADGAQAALTGNRARLALGLRSTWFTPVLFTLSPPARRTAFGGSVTLTGTAAGADGIALESRPYGGDWAPAGPVDLRRDGSFAAPVRPPVSTAYRLAWGSARIGLAKITVTARVTAAPTPAGVAGTVAPAAAGTPLLLQARQPDGTWRTVSSTTLGAGASWSLGGAVPAGTYRARAMPGHGVAAGVSPVFTVP